MKHEKIKELNDEKFRRLTGVKRGTFNKMLVIIKEANQLKQAARRRYVIDGIGVSQGI